MSSSSSAPASTSTPTPTASSSSSSSTNQASPTSSSSAPAPTNCPQCPTCFTCASEGCLNFGTCTNGQCVCADGLGGKDCGLATCNSTNVPANLRAPRPDKGPCGCDAGFAGNNCNVCVSDDACASTANVPADQIRTGDKRICNRSPRVFRKHNVQCEIVSPEVKGLFPGGMDITIMRDLTARRGFATIWLKGAMQFSCQFQDCNVDVRGVSPTDPAADIWRCGKVQCKCLTRTEMCGGGGLVDISGALNQVTSNMEMTCPLPANSTAPNAAAKVSEKTDNGVQVRTWTDGPSCTLKLGGLDALLPNGLQLANCLNGECAYPADAPADILALELGKWSPAEIGGTAAIGAVALLSLVVLFFLIRQRAHFRAMPPPLPKKGMAYTFRNVTYTVNDRTVLNNVTGVLPSASLTAIMGPSGAGKSSMLDILAHKKKRGQVDATFALDGEAIDFGDKSFRHAIGFVDQEDVLLPWLTVGESLWFVANTRLAESISHEAKAEIIDRVLKDLNIEHLRDTRIGGAGYFRGISGGERRRVSIAAELVTGPSILFLDECTSGLDSYNAHKLVESLARLAHKQGKTVVLTIHQPRSDIFEMFDNVLLLAKGQLLYHGPAADANTHFAAQGRVCPTHYNVADFLIDLSMEQSNGRASSDSAESLGVEGDDGAAGAEGHRRSQLPPITPMFLTCVSKGQGRSASAAHENERRPSSQSMEATAIRVRHDSKNDEEEMPVIPSQGGSSSDSSGPGPGSSTKQLSTSEPGRGYAVKGPEYQVSYLTQVTCLLGRNAKCLVRNRRLLIGHNVLGLALGLLLGVLYFQSPLTIPGLQNRIGSVFFLQALLAFGSLSALGGIADDRLLFLRERGNASYKPSAFFVNKVVLDVLPLRLLPALTMGTAAYFLIGFQNDGLHFVKYMCAMLLFAAAAATSCMAVGVVVADVGLATLVAAITILFAMLFGGILINAKAIPAAARWIQYLSIFRYGTEALAVNEVQGLMIADNFNGIEIRVAGEAVLDTIFGFRPGAYLVDVLVLAGVNIIVLAILGSLVVFRMREIR